MDVSLTLKIDKLEKDLLRRNYKYLGFCLSSALLSLSLMVYLVIINLKLQGYLAQNFLWMYTLPLQVFAIFSIIAMIHYIRRIKKLNDNPVSCVINMLVISLAVFGTVFCILLDMKMDNLTTLDYGIVFLPFDFLLAAGFMSVCFTLPGYFMGEKKDVINATLLMVYYFVGVVWTAFLILRLDGSVRWSYLTIFAIPFVALVTHAVLVLVDLKDRETKDILKQIGILAWICLCLGLIMINLSGKIILSWGLIFIPLYMSNLAFFVYVIFDTFISSRKADD